MLSGTKSCVAFLGVLLHLEHAVINCMFLFFSPNKKCEASGLNVSVCLCVCVCVRVVDSSDVSAVNMGYRR